MELSYWNHNGIYQEQYNKLYDMIPRYGKTGYVELEAVRAVSRIYHDFHNNGFGNNWSGPFRYLETLDIPMFDLIKEKFKPYMTGQQGYQGHFDESDHMVVGIEMIMDSVISYAMIKYPNFTPTDVDMFDLTICPK